MSNSVMKRQETAVSNVSESDIVRYLDMIGSTTQLSDSEKQLFIMKCVSEGLNPHKGDIYPIVYNSREGRKVNMITAYHVFIRRAEQTGKLKHWRVWTEGSKDTRDLVAFIEIERADWDKPFIFDVDFAEFVGSSSLWNQKPKHMLKKCAIGNGFRLAFPEDCGALYLEEEMVQPVYAANVIEETTVAKPKKRSRSEQMAEQIRKETPAVPEDADPFEENVEDAEVTPVTLIERVLDAINTYVTEKDYEDAVALAKQLTDSHDLEKAREAFRARAQHNAQL